MNLFKRRPKTATTKEEMDALSEYIATNPDKYKRVLCKDGMTREAFHKSLKRNKKRLQK